jgi:hypothetical protein
MAPEQALAMIVPAMAANIRELFVLRCIAICSLCVSLS